MIAKVSQALRGGMFIWPNGLVAPLLSPGAPPREVGAELPESRLARIGGLEAVMAMAESPAGYAAAIDRPEAYDIGAQLPGRNPSVATAGSPKDGTTIR